MSEALLPPPTAPRFLELRPSTQRQACSAGGSKDGGPRGWASASPTGVTMLRSRAHLRRSGPAPGRDPSGPQPSLSQASCPAELLAHLLPGLPCMWVSCPPSWDAGGHRPFTPSPASAFPTHSLWLPGQNCALVTAGPAARPLQASSVLSVGPQPQPQGAPSPGSLFPALAHRAWTS